MSRERFIPRPPADLAPVPFATTEEAWFWFMQCHEASCAGARIRAGAGEVPRPCEPADMLRTLDRLYRHRRLLREHVAVLAHYGRRLLAPDPQRRREQRAWGLWDEALARLEPVLRRKGIVQ